MLVDEQADELVGVQAADWAGGFAGRRIGPRIYAFQHESIRQVCGYDGG